MRTRTSIIPATFAAISTLTACSSSNPTGHWPSYPGHTQSVVDVQAFRDGPTLSFTNTSPETLGPGRLWINAAYSIDIEAVAPNASASVDLNSCRNEFGQPFRGGGFFATERPDEVVLAQIEDASGSLTGLLVATRPSGLN